MSTWYTLCILGGRKRGEVEEMTIALIKLYAGPRNVTVLTLHDNTTIRVLEYLYLLL